MATWMMKKEGLMGGYINLSERYDEKGNATHIRLTVKEYDDLQKHISNLKKDAEKARKMQYQAEDQLRDGIKKAKEDAEKAIEEGRRAMAAELKQAKIDKMHAENQRAQLIEIMKNRANAKRGIKPKKTHDGYRVLRSEQFEFGYQIDRKTRKTLTLWRTTVETPIDIRIHAVEAEKLIHEAFLHRIGARLGFQKIAISKKSLADNIKAVSEEDWKRYVYLLDIKYRQNTRSELWEVTYIHNLAITAAEEMYEKSQ